MTEFSVIFSPAVMAALIWGLRLLDLGERSLTTLRCSCLLDAIWLWSNGQGTAGDALDPELPPCFEKGDEDVVMSPQKLCPEIGLNLLEI